MKKYLGKTLKGRVASLHMGNNEDLSKQPYASLAAEIGGFSGDKHQGPVRKTREGEWQIAARYSTHSGQPLTNQSWLRPAAGRRGVVGVIDVPGEIRTGDEVGVRIYEEPTIRLL